jgi:hypothetical protein
MPLVLADRVNETTTTTSTGTVTLAGAVSGYQSFAVIGNANTTYYTIVHQTANEWEVGIGTYTSSGTTLSRDTVLSSSNGGSLVNFSAGTKFVFCDYPAGRAVYLDTATNVTIPGLTLSGGTANGVLYLNGSKVATSGSALSFDGTNLGIGTTSPTQKLDVNGGAAVTGTTPLFLQRAVIPSFDGQGAPALDWQFYSTGTTYTVGARIQGLADDAWSSTSAPTSLRFYTAPSGSTSISERMRISNAGNVGIGTTSPANYTNYRNLAISGTTGGNIDMLSGSTKVGNLFNDGTNFYAYNVIAGSLVFGTNNTERARIDSSGNLGIGTSSPNRKLEVNGGISRFTDGTSNVEITNGGGVGYIGPQTNHPLAFQTNNTERMRLDSSGNLGIGTTSPAARLDVTGIFNGTQAVFGNTAGRGLLIGTALNGGVNEGSSVLNSRGAGNGQFLFQTDGTTRMTLTDSGNLGLGVTPSAWSGVGAALQVGTSAAIIGNSVSSSSFISNAYFDGTNYRYIGTGFAMRLALTSGAYAFTTAASGTAGNAITFTQAMTLDASGNLGVGVTSPSARVDVRSAIGTSVDGSQNINAIDTTAYAQGNGGGISFGYVFNSSGGLISRAGVIKAIKENSTDGNYASALTFSTTANSASTTERARITSAGNLQVQNGKLVVSAGSGDSYAANLSCAYNFPTVDTYLDSYAGASYSGQIMFRTNSGGGAMTERARIDSSGNFLIGNTSGVGRLYVETSATPAAVIRNTTAASYTSLRLYNDINSANRALEIDYFGSTYSGGERAEITTTGAYPLCFLTSNVERARITSGGSFQLGSTSGTDPRLLVYDNDSTDAAILVRQDGSAPVQIWQGSGGGELARITSGGALLVGATSTINSSKILAQGNSYGWIGTGSGVDGTYIDWFAIAPYSADTNEQHRIRVSTSSIAASSGIQFMISNGGGSSAQTESFRINRTSCTVVGSLSKGSGSFKIDHPLKPDTHHLVHSFIEGPQADLIYRGKATLVNGKATINIDSAAGITEGTFVSLCREVQCFTSNESDWDAVRGLVDGNLLTIESQNTSSSAAVSWLVIGERQDKHMYETEWTDENGKVIVEPVKS